MIKRISPFFVALFLTLSLAGCGGGGGDTAFVESTPLPGPVEGPAGGAASSLVAGMVMSWNAPENYTDTTDLNPEVDLEAYEIFVNESGTFGGDEDSAAYLSALDSNGNPVESFDLENLEVPFSSGKTYYICMRTVTKAGVLSEFSEVIPLML